MFCVAGEKQCFFRFSVLWKNAEATWKTILLRWFASKQIKCLKSFKLNWSVWKICGLECAVFMSKQIKRWQNIIENQWKQVKVNLHQQESRVDLHAEHELQQIFCQMADLDRRWWTRFGAFLFWLFAWLLFGIGEVWDETKIKMIMMMKIERERKEILFTIKEALSVFVRE